MIEHDAADEIVEPVTPDIGRDPARPATEPEAATMEDAKTSSTPDVDELENRLRDLQGAMDQIQTGDLDAAEQAIEALEQRMKSTRE